jgi:GxxExxY protein
MFQQPSSTPKHQVAMLHEELTKTINRCAFEVIKELGAGFLESVYHNALRLALEQRGLSVTSQHPIAVHFRGQCVGTFYADLFVADAVIVEIKAVKALATEHQAQVINDLKATCFEVGLLLNFGNSKLEFKRLTRHRNIDTKDVQDEKSPSWAILFRSRHHG